MHGPDSVTSATATSNDGGSSRIRTGGPRRGLPTGRALVGGLLVTIAAVLVFSAYAGAQSRPSTSVVVAGRDLDPGDRLTAADLEVRTIDVPADVADRTFADTQALLGAAVLGPVAEGELVQEGAVRLTASPDGNAQPEFSFPVDRERALSGDLQAGESVDLLATFGSGSDATTEVVARGARLLHVQETRNGTLGSSGRLVLTVGLGSEDEVVDVAHASQVATITVVRASAGSGS